MKKFLFVLMIAVSAFSFAPAAQGNETIEKLVLYLPNRVVDMFDLFSCSLGFGPKAQAELMFTRMVGGGVSVGASANLYKDCNRQYGWGLQNGWHWQIPGLMQILNGSKPAVWCKAIGKALSALRCPISKSMIITAAPATIGRSAAHWDCWCAENSTLIRSNGWTLRLGSSSLILRMTI